MLLLSHPISNYVRIPCNVSRHEVLGVGGAGPRGAQGRAVGTGRPARVPSLCLLITTPHPPPRDQEGVENKSKECYKQGSQSPLPLSPRHTSQRPEHGMLKTRGVLSETTLQTKLPALSLTLRITGWFRCACGVQENRGELLKSNRRTLGSPCYLKSSCRSSRLFPFL